MEELHEDIFFSQKDTSLSEIRDNKCMFDGAKICTGCFQCIGKIGQMPAEQLSVMESVRLLEYKLFQVRLDRFGEKVNEYFHKNANQALDAHYMMHLDIDQLFHIDTRLVNRESRKVSSLENLSAGARSLYMLSVLEAYAEEEDCLPCIILIEDPELFLHPQLQKVASEILYHLSMKNQIIFSTHSPNMIFNFTSKQIRQVILDKNYCTTVQETTNLSVILNDLGYTASDLMDVSFVFFVEGKQDKSRLPLLLKKYYSEIQGEHGEILRTAIISTNSCTNIRTYANLKYMNQLYIKDQFLMIRDGDGKDKEKLIKELCGYYNKRNQEDEYTLPRVTPKNVLILKYYSFENYFLDPKVMTKIGVVKSEEQFFTILWKKYKQYLYKLASFKNLKRQTGIQIKTKQDLIDNFEQIKIYGRGHNLYDIFYGRYRKNEQEILMRYIEEAPRETFGDILEAIDNFVYFQNRKK
jgi:predicted ATP-dependent endonuclease of OLD family